MTGANNELTVHINLELPEDQVGMDEMQLVNNQLSAGQHSIIWNGKDDNNKTVSSGIYFYKIKLGDFQATRKMLMMK